jgi:hypothetical protein
MNNPDHISESLEIFFGLQYLKSLMWIRDPGKKNSDPESEIRDVKNLVPDPQQCFFCLMMEGSRSGSDRSKNIRIRIHNTASGPVL